MTGQTNYCIGIAKRVVNKDNVYRFLTEICQERNITNMNIDFNRDFITKRIVIEEKEYDFIDVKFNTVGKTIEEMEDLVNKIVLGVLDRGVPCYRGDVYYKTPYPTIFKKGIIIHVPDERGNVDGGISVVLSYVDYQCKLEFPTKSCINNDPIIKYYPLDLELPITYAEFSSKAQDYLLEVFGRTDKTFLKRQMESLAKSGKVYDAQLVWLNETPDSIEKVMSVVDFKNYKATDFIKEADLRWLGLERFSKQMKKDLDQDTLDTLDVIRDFMEAKDKKDLELLMPDLYENYMKSKFKGKKVRVKRGKNDNEVIIRIEEDEEKPERIAKIAPKIKIENPVRKIKKVDNIVKLRKPEEKKVKKPRPRIKIVGLEK